MKALFVAGLCILTVTVAGAQVRARPAPTAPLGHFPANASSRPLGGVALPTFPANAAARSKAHRPTAARYIGPVYYVPNASDLNYNYAPEAPPAEELPPPPPPRFSRRQAPPPPDSEPAAPALNSGAAPDENYYLVAYKNHSIYSAKSYWIDGETMHYITLQDTHNQASLNFIDLEATAKLNADR